MLRLLVFLHQLLLVMRDHECIDEVFTLTSLFFREGDRPSWLDLSVFAENHKGFFSTTSASASSTTSTTTTTEEVRRSKICRAPNTNHHLSSFRKLSCALVFRSSMKNEDGGDQRSKINLSFFQPTTTPTEPPPQETLLMQVIIIRWPCLIPLYAKNAFRLRFTNVTSC